MYLYDIDFSVSKYSEPKSRSRVGYKHSSKSKTMSKANKSHKHGTKVYSSFSTMPVGQNQSTQKLAQNVEIGQLDKIKDKIRAELSKSSHESMNSGSQNIGQPDQNLVDKITSNVLKELKINQMGQIHTQTDPKPVEKSISLDKFDNSGTKQAHFVKNFRVSAIKPTNNSTVSSFCSNIIQDDKILVTGRPKMDKNKSRKGMRTSRADFDKENIP